MDQFFNTADLYLISPLIALFLVSLIPILYKVIKGNVEQSSSLTLIQGLIGIVLAMGLLIIFGGSGKMAFNNSLVFDGITTWMGVIALGAAGASLILMYENASTNGDQFAELTFLTLNSALGMLILVSAIDLIMIFIGLEVMSLSVYLMIGMSHEQKLSKESALKYFVLGSIASAVFLYGVAFVFGTNNSTSVISIMENAAELVNNSKLFLFGISLIIIGFSFKISIMPFHAWTPDVYQGAPTPHTAFMATAVKVVSVAAFLRIIASKVLVGSENLFLVLQWFAVITMVGGSVAALMQKNLKRMLAYSSISHSGYLLVGIIATGVSSNGAFTASSVIFYLIGYAFMTIGSFAIISIFEKNEDSQLDVDDISGMGVKYPVLALCLSMFLISLAGLPPTLGFFGKFYLFNAAIGEGLLWLALWGVLSSVISVYYYLKPIVSMYMKDGEIVIAQKPINATMLTAVISAIVVLCLGLVSGSVFQAVEKALL